MAARPAPRKGNSGSRTSKPGGPPKPTSVAGGAGKTKPTPAGGKTPAKKVSNWKGKDTNLTAAQRKAAVRVVGTKGGKTRTEAVKKAERAASRKAVDISTTKWNTAKDRGGKGRGGLLTGADGKPVTGTVKLPNGRTASYVRGKRISVMASKPKPEPRRAAKPSSGGNGGSGPSSPPKPDKPGKKPDKGMTSGTVSSALAKPKPKPTGGAVPQSTYNSQVPKPPNNGYQSYAEAANNIPGNPNDGKWGVDPNKIGTGTRKAPKRTVATSPNKRGGERRTAEQIAREKTQKYIKSQKPWGTGA